MKLMGVDNGSPLMVGVQELYRSASSTLGFLPEGAFQERAAKGTLLSIVDSGAVVAYALYDLPREHVALRHLCVAPTHQGRGLASQLVEEIANRHSDRRGIRVRCRRDWPANGMWPRLDFEPLSSSPGRSGEGHLLTTWWRDFGHPTLFSSWEDSDARPVAAIDTNVFLDLVLDREGSDESQQLLSDWVAEQAFIVATKEVAQEVHRHEDDAERERALKRLGSIPRPIELSGWKDAYERLRAIFGDRPLTRNDEGDLRHLARAHSCGARYFITRDDKTVRKLRAVARDQLGIQVIWPGEFTHELWSSGNRYTPARLEDTEFRVEDLEPGQIELIGRSFLDHSQGEKLTDLERLLRSKLARPMECEVRVVKAMDGESLGLFAREVGTRQLTIDLLRTRGDLAHTLARQMVYLQRCCALEHGIAAIHVVDPKVSPAVMNAMQDESFVSTDEGWVGASIRTAGTPVEVADELAELPVDHLLGIRKAVAALRGDSGASVIDEIETRFWPLKLFSPSMPTYLVPIHPHFAERLFDADLSARTLFSQDPPLGLSREHVYYRSPRRNIKGVPARILWYVTKRRMSPGTGAVRACSRLVEVAVAHPKTLYRRFSHLGVYNEEEVVEASERGRAMAMRFTHTEPLDPVPLEALRAAAGQHGHRVHVRSPSLVHPGVFEYAYRRGTHVG